MCLKMPIVQMVRAMAGYGIPHDKIAVLIRDGISVDTLKKYYKRELDTGRAAAHAKIGQTLFQKAVEGDTACLIFYLKSQMGWSERQSEKNPDDPDEKTKPARLEIVVVQSPVPMEQRIQGAVMRLQERSDDVQDAEVILNPNEI